MPLADILPVEEPAREPPTLLWSKDWRLEFRPLLRHGDLQTVVARYWPQSLDERRFPTESRIFRTDPDTKVLAKLNAQPGDMPASLRPTVLAIHGLTACDRAPYMISMARTALESGFDVARLNVRNCGGTEHLCRTLYHSGLTADLREVVNALAPRPLFVVGFSMGGNMALKLAGEWGASPPSHVRAVCAVSPPVKLDLCSKNIGLPRNIVYERRFLRQLRAALRRKKAAMPEFSASSGIPTPGSIWEFDELVTAPSFGFRDAKDYYRRCSAAGFLQSIRLPCLVIHAQDDPFIPFEAFDLAVLRENPWLSFLSPPNGGHVAFLARGRRRFWAQEQAMRYFDAIRQEARH